MAKHSYGSPCASSAKKRKYAAKYQPERAIQVDFICASDKVAMLAQFVAKHNLPFSLADHFTKLAKQLIPDSDIEGKFTSGRMKATMIVKKALTPRLDANVVQLCQNHNFSLRK